MSSIQSFMINSAQFVSKVFDLSVKKITAICTVKIKYLHSSENLSLIQYSSSA